MAGGKDRSGDGTAGYGKPPKAHRFRPGQSGNPSGRPKRSPGKRVHFLDRLVRAEVRGRRVRMKRSAWFFLQLRQLALAGNDAAARMLVEADARIEQAKRKKKVECITIVVGHRIGNNQFEIESLSHSLCSLGMARKMYPYASTARILLEPRLVEAALERWEGPELTGEEQAEVTKATRCPHRVRWPDWWLPELRGKPRKAARRG